VDARSEASFASTTPITPITSIATDTAIPVEERSLQHEQKESQVHHQRFTPPSHALQASGAQKEQQLDQETAADQADQADQQAHRVKHTSIDQTHEPSITPQVPTRREEGKRQEQEQEKPGDEPGETEVKLKRIRKRTQKSPTAQDH
jgi:hypothetical protein